ncbi:hypothetical protein RIF29_24792 [Crotalaria pallida]|uniref:Uncharacterized protein n=1 Tax=Crotalaria pallida TaxID=3830 RepID=A0AAN9HYR5_CROPI
MDKEFWKNIVECLKGAYPLIKVLRLVDSEEKPAMGFIYEEMDQAKEKIQTTFNDIKKSYLPIWEIIDQRWDNQLHRPLHAAGYYLNPKLHYAPRFKVDFEVKRGLYDYLERMVGNMEEVTKIDEQLEDFKNKEKFFGSSLRLAPRSWFGYSSRGPSLYGRVYHKNVENAPNDEDWVELDQVEDTNVDASATANAPLEDELPNFDNDDHVDEDVMVEDDYYDVGLQNLLN